MYKILQLLIDDFQNRKLSAEYKLVQLKVYEAEEKFMGLLSKEQKAEYLKLEFTEGELHMIEFDEFAKFLFENLKNIFKS